MRLQSFASYLPALVMIISVPRAWNLRQRSREHSSTRKLGVRVSGVLGHVTTEALSLSPTSVLSTSVHTSHIENIGQLTRLRLKDYKNCIIVAKNRGCPVPCSLAEGLAPPPEPTHANETSLYGRGCCVTIINFTPLCPAQVFGTMQPVPGSSAAQWLSRLELIIEAITGPALPGQAHILCCRAVPVVASIHFSSAPDNYTVTTTARNVLLHSQGESVWYRSLFCPYCDYISLGQRGEKHHSSTSSSPSNNNLHNMKTALVFLAVVATVVIARPQFEIESADRQPPVQRTEVHDLKGQFNSNYKTVTGTDVSEQGRLVENDAKNDTVLVLTGEYKYDSPEGVPVYVTWTAGKDGFHAEGSTIPKVSQ
ncbi:hypothetical protein B566_EDAN006813 [Ephemera danica]|nr:hypothetical protein B566_EDAN006813 [Ephemera danica]